MYLPVLFYVGAEDQAQGFPHGRQALTEAAPPPKPLMGRDLFSGLLVVPAQRGRFLPNSYCLFSALASAVTSNLQVLLFSPGRAFFYILLPNAWPPFMPTQASLVNNSHTQPEHSPVLIFLPPKPSVCTWKFSLTKFSEHWQNAARALARISHKWLLYG